MRAGEHLLETISAEVGTDCGIAPTVDPDGGVAVSFIGCGAEAGSRTGHGAQAAVLPGEAERETEKRNTNHREKCCECAYYRDGICRLHSVTCVNSPAKPCFSQKSPS